MAFNLDGMNTNDERVGYFPYAPGIDRDGNECMMVVSYEPYVSGCNPYHWAPSHYTRYGHEFTSQEEAEATAKHAGGSWAVKSVNTDEIKIGAVHFTVVKTATNMGNVA